MGIIYSTPPKEYHRGLYVTYYNDWKDFYMSTDFTLVLDEPASPIDPAVIQTCVRLFTYLLTGDLNGEGVFWGSMNPNLIHFGYLSEIDRPDALARTVKLCGRFLDKASIDPDVLAQLPQYDKAAEVVRTFLADVTENGKYEYVTERM